MNVDGVIAQCVEVLAMCDCEEWGDLDQARRLLWDVIREAVVAVESAELRFEDQERLAAALRAAGIEL